MLINTDISSTLNTIKLIFQLQNCYNVVKTQFEGVLSDKDILLTLLTVAESIKIYNYQICVFCIFTMSANDIHVDHDYLFKMLTEIIKSKSNQTAVAAYGCNINEYIVNFLHLQSHLAMFEEFSIEQLDNMIAKTIRSCSTFTVLEIEDLYSITQFSAYTETLLSIFEIQKDFKNCLDYLTKSQDSRVTNNAFA